MENIILEAEIRELLTHGKLNEVRKNSWIPAIVYGGASKNGKSENVLLKVNEKKFSKAIGTQKRSNVIIELKYRDKTDHVVIKEIQRDIISRQLLHIDFQRIALSEKLEVSVPVHIVGEAPGVKLGGGILEHITREVKISCLPKDIPAQISVDVSSLEIGQNLSIKDIKEIPGVKILSDPNLLIVNVVAPTILEEPTVAETPATTEPEVIAKGKKPEEGEAAETTAATPAGKSQEKAAAPSKEKASPSK